MKKIGEYSVKGQIDTSESDQHRIILFDGQFDTAYRVVSFEISLKDRSSTSSEVASAKLTTVPYSAMPASGLGNREWNWDVNTEIAWATCAHDSNGISTQQPDAVIDPDNMIVEDLFIGAYSYTDAEPLNYIIGLEKYDISDSQGALAMVKNRAQT
tara:strand:- start:835 stop:1302 length:468 start_codon:yes stop_codon:yes gene_type:complete